MKELLVAVCAEVCIQFERVIMKSVYNRLGGLQLDKDFRSLSSYLTNIAGWVVREKCARLSQVSFIMRQYNIALCLLEAFINIAFQEICQNQAMKD